MKKDKGFGKRTLMNENRRGIQNHQINLTNKVVPFRISDEIMKMGKYKGIKVTAIPKHYLQWLLTNVEMTDTHTSMIKDIVDGKIN